jgi:hypothetical protein
LTPNRRCPYCQQAFQPSPYRLQQRACSQAQCQRQRRADYHRQKIRTDPLYAQVVRDSRKQWRAEHAGYQKNYWQSHPETAERNRTQQRQRDRQRRVARLVKNNVALDLKRSTAEVWLVGTETADLVKNNVAFSEVLVFQRVVPALQDSCKEQRPGSGDVLLV